MSAFPSSALFIRFLVIALLLGSLMGALAGGFGFPAPVRIGLFVVGFGGLAIGVFRWMRTQGPTG